jgi:hypothetical protein
MGPWAWTWPHPRVDSKYRWFYEMINNLADKMRLRKAT